MRKQLRKIPDNTRKSLKPTANITILKMRI